MARVVAARQVPVTRDRTQRVDLDIESLTGEVVDHVERPEAPAAIERIAPIGQHVMQDRHPMLILRPVKFDGARIAPAA